MEELLQERMQKTLQALAVATSELEVYRNQGKIASLQELMKMKEQIKRK
jgi:7-keto-8-aminopelargonate synthetase-like enzyme